MYAKGLLKKMIKTKAKLMFKKVQMKMIDKLKTKMLIQFLFNLTQKTHA